MESSLAFLVCLAVVGLVPSVTSYGERDQIAQAACAAQSSKNFAAFALRRSCQIERHKSCNDVCDDLGNIYQPYESPDTV